MTELTAETVRFGFAGLNLLTFVVAVLLYTRTPPEIRKYAGVAVAVIGISPPIIVLQELGYGAIALGNGSLDVLALLQGTVSTIVIYGLVLASAKVSRRIAAITIAVALVPTVGAEIIAVAGEDPSGILAAVVLVSFLASFFIPFPALLYLFFGPVWRAASDATPQQRLLHWKARNILLFAYGMLLAYTPLVLAGLITDPVLGIFVQEYSVFFLYSGIILYLLYNYSSLDSAQAETVDDYVSRLVGSRTSQRSRPSG